MFKEPKFTETIAECDEINLYFLIDHAGGFIWRMNHDMADDRIPREHHAGIDSDVMKAREQQQRAVEQCSRFGFEPLKDGQPTDEYWSWFRMWDGWKKSLTDEDWREFNAALSRGLTDSEVEAYRCAAMQHKADMANAQ